MRNKNKTKNIFLPPLPSSQENFIPNFSTYSHSEQHRGIWKGVLWSVHSHLSLPLLPSTGLPLLQCGVPHMGYSPSLTAATRVLPTGCNSSTTTLMWVLFMEYRSPGTDCSRVAPSWATAPARSLFQHGVSMAYSFLQGSPPSAVWVSALVWSPHRLQGDDPCHCGLSMNCREIFAFVPGSLPYPPSSMILVVSLTFFHSPLTVAVHHFHPFLKMFS